MTFLKPEGEENTYVQFLYAQQKSLNHTQGQVPGLMKTDTINTNNQVNNQQC